ncbi:hypothetical protein HY312_02650 [Candidatus Saccharibacteria bacterium]|nr:hypothetical protein [Candidatus Saccharibacteria bacterium]
MTAEVHGFESTPTDQGNEPPERTERLLEVVPDIPHAELAERASEVYEQFKRAFGWSEPLQDELFSRVAGDECELSDELRARLIDLFFVGRGSAFVQDEVRANYKFIFEAFTKDARNVAQIRDSLQEQGIVPYEVDHAYVSKHLLTTISKMSMHQE